MAPLSELKFPHKRSMVRLWSESHDRKSLFLFFCRVSAVAGPPLVVVPAGWGGAQGDRSLRAVSYERGTPVAPGRRRMMICFLPAGGRVVGVIERLLGAELPSAPCALLSTKGMPRA